MLVTDSKPLSLILGPKKGIPAVAAARIQRWAIFMSAFQYDIQLKTSKDNANADMLSRFPCPSETDFEENMEINWVEEASRLNVLQVNSLPITAQMIKDATRRDPVLSKVLYFTQNGWPAKNSVMVELKPCMSRKNEFSSEDGCLLWGIGVLIPQTKQAEILKYLHENHPGMVQMKSVARMQVWWSKLDSDIEQQLRDCQCCMDNTTTSSSIRENPWVWPNKPWQRVHIDFAKFEGENYLILVDANSKWP